MQAMVARAFNPRTWEVDVYEFKTNLVYNKKIPGEYQGYTERACLEEKKKATKTTNFNAKISKVLCMFQTHIKV